jgi:hypothetical protein
VPGRIPQPTTRRPQPQPNGGTRTAAPETRVTDGILRQLSTKELIIESFDYRVIWYRLSDDVEFDRSKLNPGDHLTVTSTEDDQGNYTAIAIQRESTGTSEDRARAAQTWDLPNPIAIQAQETNDRPKLTRGKQTAEPEAAPTGRPASDRVRTGPMPNHPDDAAIASAREAAFSFIDDLPNFAAKQNTTRYIQENSRAQWRALDIVTADLVYKDGAEDYTNIKLNNKPTSKPLEEIDGLHSTGEFGSILANLFDPESGTDFARPSQVIEKGHKAWKYRFETPRERSDFRISTPSQLYYAGYSGSVWIDMETSRVLRFEMQAANLPKAFPFDTVEMTIDYDFIRLEGAQQFLLPTESQALNCIRGTSVCMKNTTSFRNYVKFTSDSSIIFDAPK